MSRTVLMINVNLKCLIEGYTRNVSFYLYEKRAYIRQNETLPFFLFSSLQCLWIRISLVFSTSHLRHNLYAFMEFSYTHQCIVNRTTTAHNDTLERIGIRMRREKIVKGKATTRKKLIFFNVCLCSAKEEEEWKISLHIHIVASWIHSPTVPYSTVIIACSRAICWWCTRPVLYPQQQNNIT